MKKSKTNIYYLIFIFIYVILSQTLLNKNTSTYNNVINPTFWIINFFCLFVLVPGRYINKQNEKKIIQGSFISGITFIVVYLLSGLLVSFGKSPYSLSFKGILSNIWITVIPIIGREYTRYKIINSCKKKKLVFVNFFAVIIFTLIEFDIVSFIRNSK